MKWQLYSKELKIMDDWLTDAEQTLMDAETELTPQTMNKIKVFNS